MYKHRVYSFSYIHVKKKRARKTPGKRNVTNGAFRNRARLLSPARALEMQVESRVYIYIYTLLSSWATTREIAMTPRTEKRTERVSLSLGCAFFFLSRMRFWDFWTLMRILFWTPRRCARNHYMLFGKSTVQHCFVRWARDGATVRADLIFLYNCA